MPMEPVDNMEAQIEMYLTRTFVTLCDDCCASQALK